MLVVIPVIIIAVLVLIFSGGALLKDFDFPNIIPQTQEKKVEQTPPKDSAPTSIPKSSATPTKAPSPTTQPTTILNNQKTSPYAGKVEISGITSPTTSQTSRITLQPKFSDTETISITGFRFETTIDRYTIPQAVEQLAKLDVAGVQRKNIILKSNEQVIISSATNPLANNLNFKPNECFGFFAKDRKFPIGIPSSCQIQRLKLEDVSFLSPLCQDFALQKIDSCTFPEFRNVPGVGTDFDCYRYLENLEDQFTYENCYQKHFQDSGFFKNEWHIYTDGEEFLRPVHDRVTLYDQNGLLIDEYIY